MLNTVNQSNYTLINKHDKMPLSSHRPPAYERVYLPLFKVADTPFHIQGDDIGYS